MELSKIESELQKMSQSVLDNSQERWSEPNTPHCRPPPTEMETPPSQEFSSAALVIEQGNESTLGYLNSRLSACQKDVIQLCKDFD